MLSVENYFLVEEMSADGREWVARKGRLYTDVDKACFAAKHLSDREANPHRVVMLRATLASGR